MSTSPPVYQVSDLVNEMRDLVEMSYPEIWIEGELSSLSTPASGHLYFSLKDERSQLRCAMFRSRANLNKYKPKAGDLVRVRAKISVYPARGDLQCIVQFVEEAGEGLLQRRYEELKNKLNSQGLFDNTYKKPLPNFARHIGVITSPSGAAVRDILSTLKRRCPGIPITIYPAVVQGDNAPGSLIEAILTAQEHQHCDVLILARGGGSLEDLWCFNDETLAQEIFSCPIPIVSGVGHEVDVTIADLVADQRASTPTAAAEMLSPDTRHLQDQVENFSQRLSNSAQRKFQQLAQHVDHQFDRLIHPRRQLENKQEALQKCLQRITQLSNQALLARSKKLKQFDARFHALSPKRKIAGLKEQQRSLSSRLLFAQRQQLKSSQQSFETFRKTLHAVSPLATLERGFSITRDQQNHILKDVAKIGVNDEVSVQLKSGRLACTVNLIQKDKI